MSAAVPNSKLPFPPLDFQPRTRIVFGQNTLAQAGTLTAALSVKRVLLVTDAGIVAAGHAAKVQKFLTDAGLTVTLFDQVVENPTTRCVLECLAVAKKARIDGLVGLGGGSAMDTAKGCNFLLTNGGRMQDYWGVGKAKKAMLPLVAIPTTAGTGSECQSAALITDEQTHQKMACLDPKAAARIAVLDPLLTVSQPARVTACTGIDALAHAVETAVTTKRNAVSEMFSREAFRLLAAHFGRVMQQPQDVQARAAMQLGAAYAGTAIENSMLGAAHSAANPLTAHFGIAHGQAVGMMLPHIVRFNARDKTARAAYVDLMRASGLTASGQSPVLFRAFVTLLEKSLRQAGFPPHLRACCVPKTALPDLAEEASRQWTAQFNPRPITAKDFLRLYTAAW